MKKKPYGYSKSTVSAGESRYSKSHTHIHAHIKHCGKYTESKKTQKIISQSYHVEVVGRIWNQGNKWVTWVIQDTGASVEMWLCTTCVRIHHIETLVDAWWRTLVGLLEHREKGDRVEIITFHAWFQHTEMRRGTQRESTYRTPEGNHHD